MKSLETKVKKFRILFVEDEDLAREKLGKFLRRKFEEVELCANGLEGFLKFQEAFNNGKKFDFILSDINMPKMDGLEMLEKIREIDDEIPCIFLTARNESENLIKAISLHVTEYILKPIDLEVITQKLNTLCDSLELERKYEAQKIELNNYLDVLNQEALVSKTDLKGKITFANDGFCEVSGYTKEELMGVSHNIVRHPDVSKTFFEKMWNTIKKGKIWSGTHKNLTKEGETYFVSTKIFPVFDLKKENITEYMAIRFLVTEEELEKRKNFKRFIEQLTENKKTIAKLKTEKENLDKRLLDSHKTFSILEEKARTSEEKRKALIGQLSAYEQSQLEYNKMEMMGKKDKTKQFEDMYKSLNALKSRNVKLEGDKKTLEGMYQSKEKELDDFIKKELDSQKRINDLRDLVTNLQKENEKLMKNQKHGMFS